MFHADENLFFERQENGCVLIVKKDPSGTVLFSQVISENTWCSVIATVSAGNEDDYRWYAAKQFHGSKGKVKVVRAPDMDVPSTEIAD